MTESRRSNHDYPDLQELADNPETPVDVLQRLAQHQGVRVRENVAGNPSTPIELLEQLSDDDHPDVLVAVSENPRTGPETLAKIAEYLRGLG